MSNILRCRSYFYKPTVTELTNWAAFVNTDMCATVTWAQTCLRTNDDNLSWDAEETTNDCGGDIKTFAPSLLNADVEISGTVSPQPDGTQPVWYTDAFNAFKAKEAVLFLVMLGDINTAGSKGVFRLGNFFGWQTRGETGKPCELTATLQPTGCVDVNPLAGCIECGVVGFTPFG